jgi:hypothetical protein
VAQALSPASVDFEASLADVLQCRNREGGPSFSIHARFPQVYSLLGKLRLFEASSFDRPDFAFVWS